MKNYISLGVGVSVVFIPIRKIAEKESTKLSICFPGLRVHVHA